MPIPVSTPQHISAANGIMASPIVPRPTIAAVINAGMERKPKRASPSIPKISMTLPAASFVGLPNIAGS